MESKKVTISLSRRTPYSWEEHFIARIFVMPAQWFNNGYLRQGPEFTLLIDLLRQAVCDILGLGLRKNQREKACRETWEWIMSDDQRWPFAFVNVCETLKLDPSWVRKIFLELLQNFG